MRTAVEKLPSVIRDKCGTHAGYSAHRNHKETTCQPCRDAKAVYDAKWRMENPEKLKTYSATWREANPEKEKVRHIKYRIENPEKMKVARARYRSENSEKLKASRAKYRADNAEKIKKYKSEYHIAHPEIGRAISKLWHTEHPEKGREKQNRRRAKKRGNGFSPYTEEQILEKYGTDCHICHEPIDMTAPRQCGKPGWERGLQMEHVLAVENGGRDDLENVRPSHGLCNVRKGYKLNTIQV